MQGCTRNSGCWMLFGPSGDCYGGQESAGDVSEDNAYSAITQDWLCSLPNFSFLAVQVVSLGLATGENPKYVKAATTYKEDERKYHSQGTRGDR